MTGARRSISLLSLLILCLSLGASTAAQEVPNEEPAPGSVGQPAEPVASRHLYDYANLLDDGQEASIETDADRLQRFGIPAVILVQASDMTPDDAVAYASEIGTQWSVESSPGAADGLVMLVIVDLSEEKHVFTVMAWGENALPSFGVNQEVARTIHERWLDGYAQQGYIYEGILYSLRRLVYHSIYDPAPEGELSGPLAVLHRIVSWLAPIVGLAGVAATLARWSRWLDLPAIEGRNLDLALMWAMPVLAIVIAALAVWTESGTGVLSALALGVIATAGWLRRDPDGASHAMSRQVAS